MSTLVPYQRLILPWLRAEARPESRTSDSFRRHAHLGFGFEWFTLRDGCSPLLHKIGFVLGVYGRG